MKIFNGIFLVLVISVVQYSCYRIPRKTKNEEITHEIEDYLKNEKYGPMGALFGIMDDADYIANLLKELGVEDPAYIADLRFLLEDDYDEKGELLNLKEKDYDNDQIDCETHSTFETKANFKGDRKSCAIGKAMLFRSIISEENTLSLVIEKLRAKIPSSPKIWRLKARLEGTYRKIIDLIGKNKRYNYSLLSFFITLHLKINRHLDDQHRITAEESIKRIEKYLGSPVIRFYLQHLTGISDLKEGYISNLYKEHIMELKEYNELNRKLRKESKELIDTFITIILVDIEEYYFPIATLDFILDKIEDIIPLIDRINRESRSLVKRSAGDRKSPKIYKTIPKPGEDEDFDAQVKQAQEELKEFILEITEMTIEGFFKLISEVDFSGLE